MVQFSQLQFLIGQIATQEIPVFCEIVHKHDGTVLLRLALKKPFGVIGNFGTYNLYVLKKPVSVSRLKNDFFDHDLLARNTSTRREVAEFAVAPDEIPNSFIGVSSWTGKTPNGDSKLRILCLPVTSLIYYYPSN